jgi:hypothetical protein
MTEPSVVELPLGVVPEAAVSGALLLQSEYHTFLTFNAMRRVGERYENAGTAIIELERCLMTRFGLPNDSALGGHPLARYGIEAYGCFEVLDSPWRAEAEAQNRVCFPHTDHFSDIRHFVFTFHDSSCEALARDIEVRVVEHFHDHFTALTELLYRD